MARAPTDPAVPAAQILRRRCEGRGRLARRCECSNQSGSSDGRWTAVSECLTLVERAGERRFTTQVMTAIATSDMAIAPIALVIFKGYAGLLPSLEGKSIPQVCHLRCAQDLDLLEAQRFSAGVFEQAGAVAEQHRHY